RRPQPVPPIYQPELAADAIWWAACHPRREVWLGAPTIMTIVANTFAPQLLDRYLARAGVAAQQTEDRAAANRPDNLCAPVAGDAGAHGAFDRIAKRRRFISSLRRGR